MFYGLRLLSLCRTGSQSIHSGKLRISKLDSLFKIGNNVFSALREDGIEPSHFSVRRWQQQQ